MGHFSTLFRAMTLPDRCRSVKAGYDPRVADTVTGAVALPSRRGARSRGRRPRRTCLKIRFYPFIAAAAQGRPHPGRRRARVPRPDGLGRGRPDRLRASARARRRSWTRSTRQHTGDALLPRARARPPSWPSSCASSCRATSRRRRGSARPAPMPTTASRGCCRWRPGAGGWSRSSAATTARPPARPACPATRRRRR